MPSKGSPTLLSAQVDESIDLETLPSNNPAPQRYDTTLQSGKATLLYSVAGLQNDEETLSLQHDRLRNDFPSFRLHEAGFQSQ